MPSIKQFYERIDSKINLNDLFLQVSKEYNLGDLSNWELIPFGYSDFNVKLTTSSGRYFVKIFSKRRDIKEIKDIVNRFLTLSKNDIPVPKLFICNGQYIYNSAHHGNINLSVMEYIEGKNFTKISPNFEDIKKATQILGKINQLSFQIRKTYDSWGTVNLITEFEKRKEYLAKVDLVKLKPIVKAFQLINFADFRKSIIHGDFHGEHFFKDKSGKYWVIDFETMDFAPSVVDLAIFLATFPLNEKASLCFDKKISQLVLDEYLKYVQLSDKEISSLETLTKATFAIYLIRANYEKIVNKDMSTQTEYWLNWARRGLNSKIE